jgi:hypothetical protein
MATLRLKPPPAPLVLALANLGSPAVVTPAAILSALPEPDRRALRTVWLYRPTRDRVMTRCGYIVHRPAVGRLCQPLFVRAGTDPDTIKAFEDFLLEQGRQAGIAQVQYLKGQTPATETGDAS